MKSTCFRSCQIQQAQKLLRYNFKIDYRLGIKNPTNAISGPLTNKNIEKKLVEQNWKILKKLKQSLSENNHILLNINCQIIT